MPRSSVALVIGLVLAVLVAAPEALAGPRKPRVIYIHSEASAARVNDVRNKLTGSGLFETVDPFDARGATPTIGQLRQYDAALVGNNAAWLNSVALGNVCKQYIDEGYGLVQTVFTTGGVPGSNLGGTWTPDDNCIVFGPSLQNSAASLGAIALPNHPIVNGVSVFSGGTRSARPDGTALTAGATLVASWSDGKPLVAVGPKINRADLGMYAPSSDAESNLWASNTDGAKLLANALVYVMRPKVLVVESFVSALNATDVQTKLRSTGFFSVVDTFDGEVDTPTLDQLKQYDAILVANSNFWNNRVALGNVIADYTDWGGGVVQSVFTTGGIPNSDLGGRFTGDYRIISFGPSTTGTANLGAIAYAEHPIVSGVASFSGGSIGYRPASTGVEPGGLIVARWSDGKTLAAVSTKRHNRADLGMFPPSSAVTSGYWDAATDGAKLMGNALIYTIRPYVGIADSDFSAAPANTRTRLLASRRFSGVSILPKLNSATPALDALRPFGVLFSFSDGIFVNADAVGNVFADYVDAGGSVVQAVFSITGNPGLENSRPRGRWITQGYDITPEGSTGSSISSPASLGAFVGPAHPIQTFVRRFDSGASSYRQGNDPLLRGRRLIQWSDGRMLASLHSFRRRADLGFRPASSAESGNGWNVRTDGTTIIANALHFAAFMKPCPGDFNGDGQVDDGDFVIFLGYYNTLVDPRGDLTGDGNTEDADFAVFVQSYNDLVCP
ncbi:MAG: hypothetical protein J0L78_08840 [Planctomycetes bacterium]|nr:hypothetical protein [Planctomycetota bacterium]